MQLVTTREQRAEERRRLGQRKQLADRAEEVLGYYVPTSVEDSFAYGRRQAMDEEKQLPKSKFLDLAQEHPYPESLWRAYVRGFRQGRKDRRERLG